MVFDLEVGSADMRKQLFDNIVKGFAVREYKFKQAVTISNTAAWKNFFFRELPTPLTGQAGRKIKGIPRGAAFPQRTVEWQRVQAVIEKYGLEDNIFWEDLVSNDIDVRNRTLFRIAEGVAKSVDDQIWDVLTESQVAVNIQEVVIGGGWNESSAAIIDDLMQAKQLIAEKNYSTSNLMCFISPRDHRSIIKYLTDKGAQFPSIGEDMATNGRTGKLAGIQLIMSNSVTTSFALVVVPKICATWKALAPLTTVTKEDEGKSLLIRSFEAGVTQLTDPNACVLLTGTERG